MPNHLWWRHSQAPTTQGSQRDASLLTSAARDWVAWCRRDLRQWTRLGHLWDGQSVSVTRACLTRPSLSTGACGRGAGLGWAGVLYRLEWTRGELKQKTLLQLSGFLHGGCRCICSPYPSALLLFVVTRSALVRPLILQPTGVFFVAAWSAVFTPPPNDLFPHSGLASVGSEPFFPFTVAQVCRCGWGMPV